MQSSAGGCASSTSCSFVINPLLYAISSMQGNIKSLSLLEGSYEICRIEAVHRLCRYPAMQNLCQVSPPSGFLSLNIHCWYWWSRSHRVRKVWHSLRSLPHHYHRNTVPEQRSWTSDAPVSPRWRVPFRSHQTLRHHILSGHAHNIRK